MNWASGFGASFYVTIVDPVTWKDISRIDITGGTVKRTDSDLMQSADLKCIQYPYVQEQYIRLWLIAHQGQNIGHEALFTGLAVSPTKAFNGNVETNSVACYSVLKPASDILLPRGWYAPVKTDGAKLIKELLECIPAPVKIEGTDVELSQAIIAEDGETHQSMVEKILLAMGWRLRINGMGEVTVCPISSDPVVILDSIDYDIMEPVFSVENDWYECPNVLRCVMDEEVSVARDEDENSLYSIPSRGREIWAQENDCLLNENESLGEYAMRRLKELQQVGTTMEYDRRFDPRIFPSDFIRIKYPSHNIDNIFVVTSQTIELEYGGKTSEEVMML